MPLEKCARPSRPNHGCGVMTFNYLEDSLLVTIAGKSSVVLNSCAGEKKTVD
jgi:hypothetical protein